VVINGSILENPTKSQIFDRISDALTPSLHSTRSDFLAEPSLKLVYEALVSRKKGQSGPNREFKNSVACHDSSNSSPPFPIRESSPTREMKPSLV
jgi:hypothetical protein